MSRLLRRRRPCSPGRIRIALAAKLQAKLREDDPEARVEPDDLEPNQGYWRTDYRADVMPWSGWIWYRGKKVSVCSWDTMTDLIRKAGFDVFPDCTGFGLELGANDSRPHPEALRAAERK